MGDIPGNARDLIDLNRLQRIIMSIYIAGKPIITKSSIESIRIPFKFKERSSVVSLHLRYIRSIVFNSFTFCDDNRE